MKKRKDLDEEWQHKLAAECEDEFLEQGGKYGVYTVRACVRASW